MNCNKTFSRATRMLWDKRVSNEQQFLKSRNGAAQTRMRLDIARQKLLALDIEALERLPVALPQPNSGAPVMTIPLRELASFNFAEGPNQVSRETGKRLVAVTA